MVRVSLIMPMVTDTKVSSREGRSMGRESTFLEKATVMKGNSRMIKRVGRAYTFLGVGIDSRVSLAIIRGEE